MRRVVPITNPTLFEVTVIARYILPVFAATIIAVNIDVTNFSQGRSSCPSQGKLAVLNENFVLGWNVIFVHFPQKKI